jgi:hypothetical protein
MGRFNSMKKYYPNVPDGSKVVGFIYWDADLTILGEDMVDVMLPSGVLISCGWYPEGDASGTYRLTASEGFEELHRIETDDPQVASALVQIMCVAFSGRAFFVSSSGAPQQIPVRTPMGGMGFASMANRRFTVHQAPILTLVSA